MTAGPLSALALAVELAPLADLARWRPVAMRMEHVLDAMRGGDGIDQRQVDELRAWTATWRRVSPRVRAFYRVALSRPLRAGHAFAVDRALWRVLRGGDVQPWVGAALRELFEEIEGRPPTVDLTPWPRPR